MRPAGANRGHQIALYLTADHPCSYLEGMQARTLFVDPLAPMDRHTYQALVDQGFRRSGSHVYRPACRDCSRCVPVRIPVAAFTPNRSQRRSWRRNLDLIQVLDTPSRVDPEHFELYLRYLLARHPDGNMAEDQSVESYRRFLVEPWGGETRFLELRQAHRLIGVAVTDLLPKGLSAVYTFFDPDLSDQGLGTFSVLAQIEIARRLRLPHVYLGYWIGESPKMSYKDRYRPIETFDGVQWRRFQRGEPLCGGMGHP